MGRGIGDVLQTLAQVLPTWALVLLGVAIAALLIPGMRFRVKGKQVRGAVRRMVRAPVAERPVIADEAFDAAVGNHHLLAILATEARKRSFPDLYTRALEALRTTPPGRREAARIEGEVRKPGAGPMHPLEAAVRVERMLDDELWEAARARLDEALADHPHDPGLRALAERLQAEAPRA